MLLRIIVALVLIVLLEFYFFKRLSGALRLLFPRVNLKWLKAGMAVFLFLINLYPLLILINWTSQLILDGRVPFEMQGAFYDYFLIYPFWTGIIIIIQSTLLFLLFEVIKILLRFVIRRKDKLRKADAFVISCITVLSFVYVPLRIIYDYNTVEFKEVTVVQDNLNKDLEDFRLVFISDLQADRYTDGTRLQKYVDIVKQAKPHLVLAAGDFITSGPLFIDTAAVYAGAIKPPLGFFSCIGDHDHWAYREDMKRSLREISSALAKQDVHLIHNKNLSFKHKSAQILVTFVTNSYVDKIALDSLVSLTVHNNGENVKILLSHQPLMESINAAASAGYDLFLAGHTHGGQLTFLFPFRNLSPTLFETKFVHGNFKIGDMTLIVSSGLGMSLSPFRYNSTPEVILIHFKSRNQE